MIAHLVTEGLRFLMVEIFDNGLIAVERTGFPVGSDSAPLYTSRWANSATFCESCSRAWTSRPHANGHCLLVACFSHLDNPNATFRVQCGTRGSSSSKRAPDGRESELSPGTHMNTHIDAC